jgi:hypothetical protein
MAVGKNKKLGKKGKIAGKKKPCVFFFFFAAPPLVFSPARPVPARARTARSHPTFPRRVDPFTRKEWYDIKAPGMFSQRVPGKTPVTKTTGQSALFFPLA